MSYVVYTTEGFILGSTPTGEASKLYWIYTNDFGLIKAKAQSVRLMTSKLRYSLEDYSFGVFSLVKGREVWRITGASDKKYLKENAPMVARILSLVRRLVHGDGKNERLFSTLLFMLDLHGEYEKTTLELLVLIHVFSSLGYLDMEKTTGFSKETHISVDQLDFISMQKRDIMVEINKALRETQL